MPVTLSISGLQATHERYLLNWSEADLTYLGGVQDSSRNFQHALGAASHT